MQRTERMTALIQSCAKWREPYLTEIGRRKCPLCFRYNNDIDDDCFGCPVSTDTRRRYCRGTPYYEYAGAIESGKIDDGVRLKEYQYLRGLWKKEKAKCQTSN